MTAMKEMSATEIARNFSHTLTDVEHSGEEIVVVRNGRRVARLVPEAAEQDALQVFGDLYRTLDDATAERLLAVLARERRSPRRGRLRELRNPWASW